MFIILIGKSKDWIVEDEYKEKTRKGLESEEQILMG